MLVNFFLCANFGYSSVPQLLCDDIKYAFRGRSPDSANFDYGIHYGVDSNHGPVNKQEQASQEQADDISLKYDGNLSYLSSMNGTANETFNTLKAMSKTSDELFALISGQNFGDMLMKEWNNSPLTDAERDTLQEWQSEPAIRFAALGIRCIYGNDVSPTAFLLKLLLKE